MNLDALFEETKKKKFDIVIVIDGKTIKIPYHGNEILKLESRLKKIEKLKHTSIQKISSDIMGIEMDVNRGATVNGLKGKNPDFLVKTIKGKQKVENKIQIFENKKEDRMNKIDRLFEGVVNEVVKKATDDTGRHRVIVLDKRKDAGKQKLVYHFDPKYKNFNDGKALDSLSAVMNQKLGNEEVKQIIKMLKTIKDKKGAFSDKNVDININEKGFITLDTSVNEASAEVVGAIDNKGIYKLGTDKWKNAGVGPEMLKKLKLHITKRYGLDSVAGNELGDDIIYDKAKGQFTITFDHGKTKGQKATVSAQILDQKY